MLIVFWQICNDFRLGTFSTESASKRHTYRTKITLSCLLILEACKTLRCSVRAEFRSFLVPLPGASEVGLNTDDAELLNDQRIKSRAKHQRCVCAASLSGPTK